MKRFVLPLSVLIIAGALILRSDTRVHGEPSGSPAGNTASPADGQSCYASNCHTGGPATALDGLISSNIPVSGYVPGATYTITIAHTQAGINKWGFQVSPQATDGSMLGTPVITNSTQTKIVSTKYVTHKTAGNTGTGTKTWSFDWIAPAAGTGTVDFYGALMAANNNGNTSGDQVYTDVYSVTESLETGLSTIANSENLLVYPNPVTGNEFQMQLYTAASVRILDAQGKLVDHFTLEAGVQRYDASKLPQGMYYVIAEGGRPFRVMRK
jgi:hypothetical protein